MRYETVFHIPNKTSILDIIYKLYFEVLFYELRFNRRQDLKGYLRVWIKFKGKNWGPYGAPCKSIELNLYNFVETVAFLAPFL